MPEGVDVSAFGSLLSHQQALRPSTLFAIVIVVGKVGSTVKA